MAAFYLVADAQFVDDLIILLKLIFILSENICLYSNSNTVTNPNDPVFAYKDPRNIKPNKSHYFHNHHF